MPDTVTRDEDLYERFGITEAMLTADGFNDAIIGIATRCGSEAVVAYSAGKFIDILINRDGMSYDEAQEHFSFNIEGAYMGPTTPVWIWIPEGAGAA